MKYILVLCENSACALVALLEGQGLKGKRDISKELKKILSTSQKAGIYTNNEVGPFLP